MNSTKEIPLIFLVLILLLVQFYIFVDRRPFTDEGSYCTIAQAISQKMVLYRDVYNEKAPIPYFLLAPFINLNQNPILILRIISAISFGLATLILYHLLKLNGLSKLKAFAITVYFIITAPLFQSFNYTSEILALPLILFIIWQLSLNRMSKMNILCGFLTITLFFYKANRLFLFILVISIFALFSYSVRRAVLQGDVCRFDCYSRCSTHLRFTHSIWGEYGVSSDQVQEWELFQTSLPERILSVYSAVFIVCIYVIQFFQEESLLCAGLASAESSTSGACENGCLQTPPILHDSHSDNIKGISHRGSKKFSI
jgi:hypothetical protein